MSNFCFEYLFTVKAIPLDKEVSSKFCDERTVLRASFLAVLFGAIFLLPGTVWGIYQVANYDS